MLVVISYIIRLLSPVVNPMGVIGFICYIMYVVDYVTLCLDPATKETQWPVEVVGKVTYANGWLYFIVCTIVFIGGIVFGIKAYRNDIPARWLWSKSKNDLFSFSLSTVLWYAFSFVAYPYTVFLIHFFIEGFKVRMEHG